ncbi:hypothetical protein N9J43_00265 [Alphaproteobacteria bacterium]|nr:hypothetical protein [Alphaproteobacteria bacterium]
MPLIISPAKLISELNLNYAELINSLSEDRVLDPYIEIQTSFMDVDISADEDFRKTFTNFYKLRLPRGYNELFDYFEKLKTLDVEFESILIELQRITGRVEASFSSKLLHTIDTTNPVIDRLVFAKLGWSLPKSTELQQIRKTVDIYNRLTKFYKNALENEKWKIISAQFEAKINYANYTISEEKKLDTLLWKYDAYK